jgi:hypothetical protein
MYRNWYVLYIRLTGNLTLHKLPTNGILHASRNILIVDCAEAPEDEQVVLETCRGC